MEKRINTFKLRQLLIFIKNPIKGKVKTRLAKTLGKDKALEVYLQLLNYTKAVSSKVDAKKHLFYSHEIVVEDNWPTAIYQKHLQTGNDLGERMFQAFKKQLAATNPTKVVIIGSDCAELTTEIIENAFNQLDHQDVVIGPAKDGGYYLLGMKQLLPYIFEDKNWSTPSLLQETIQSIKDHGHSYYLLETLSDVDHEEDWQAIRNRLSGFNWE